MKGYYLVLLSLVGNNSVDSQWNLSDQLLMNDNWSLFVYTEDKVAQSLQTSLVKRLLK